MLGIGLAVSHLRGMNDPSAHTADACRERRVHTKAP